MITHYALIKTDTILIKEADFFISQGGTKESWGQNWKPVHDCDTVGDARRKMAEEHSVQLSHLYKDEE